MSMVLIFINLTICGNVCKIYYFFRLVMYAALFKRWLGAADDVQNKIFFTLFLQ